jgi:uncharacterized protein
MSQELQIFISTVIAIFLEASPFLMLGSLLSAVFEIYVPADVLARYLPKGRFKGLLFGLCVGMLIPTCECGVVSIVRRLLSKGVPAQVAVTYMLAAPVINPLVLASTYLAFRGDIRMVLARVALVAVCASVVGLMLSRVDPLVLLREGKTLKGLQRGGLAPFDQTHGLPAAPVFLEMAPADPWACGCGSHPGSRLTGIFVHTASELLEMGKYLLLGACAVGFFNILPPHDFLYALMDSTQLAIAGMMILAILLSVCSEADAFVAASFSSFPPVAQLSFVVIGPMVDLKLLIMYGAVFHRRVALLLLTLPTLLTYVLSSLLATVMD